MSPMRYDRVRHTLTGLVTTLAVILSVMLQPQACRALSTSQTSNSKALPTCLTTSNIVWHHPPMTNTRSSSCFSRRTTTTRLNMHNWEGDDLRWFTRMRRRLRQRSSGGDDTPAKNTLLCLNLVFFLYQTVTTVNLIRKQHSAYWPSHALSMIGDALVGSSIRGPLFQTFAFSPALAQIQPHRYLTAGFCHGGLLHLLVNMDTLRRQPSWLETGLGIPLYVTTFLLSIVIGNIGHSMLGTVDAFDRNLICGFSSGICGLYGLMFASLIRMGNQGAFRRIIRGMVTTILAGLFVESMSNRAHFAGFVCGAVMAILFSPRYKKSYSLRRKNSVEYDSAPRDFRQAMGFGVVPTERGLIPLGLLWGTLVILYAFAKPKFHAMPLLIVKGLLQPGSL